LKSEDDLARVVELDGFRRTLVGLKCRRLDGAAGGVTVSDAPLWG